MTDAAIMAQAMKAADATVPEDGNFGLKPTYKAIWYIARDAAISALEALTAAPKPRPDVLEAHISEQITHAETRIQDGIELGATVWRIALEDIVRENRAALKSSTTTQQTDAPAVVEGLSEAITRLQGLADRREAGVQHDRKRARGLFPFDEAAERGYANVPFVRLDDLQAVLTALKESI